MGEAKKRGTYEQRLSHAQAIDRQVKQFGVNPKHPRWLAIPIQRKERVIDELTAEKIRKEQLK